MYCFLSYFPCWLSHFCTIPTFLICFYVIPVHLLSKLWKPDGAVAAAAALQSNNSQLDSGCQSPLRSSRHNTWDLRRSARIAERRQSSSHSTNPKLPSLIWDIFDTLINSCLLGSLRDVLSFLKCLELWQEFISVASCAPPLQGWCGPTSSACGTRVWKTSWRSRGTSWASSWTPFTSPPLPSRS